MAHRPLIAAGSRSTAVFAGMLGAIFLILAMASARADSLKEFESQLFKREPYVQLTKVDAPAFTLTAADGRAVSLSDFKGKVVVLYFVYARCKDLCPLTNDLIASIQEKINATPMRGHVQLITIVTDTEDAEKTAEIIRGFPRRHGFDTGNWVALYRGALEPDATIKLAQQYSLKFIYAEGGDQVHSTVICLIDQRGVERARYHGLNFDHANFISHVKALIDDRPDDG